MQNIAEGSQTSCTSKKMELKLTNVARASLEELRLDHEGFLRQRGLPLWAPEHPVLMRFKARRCTTLAEVRAWVAAARGQEGVLAGESVSLRAEVSPANSRYSRRSPGWHSNALQIASKVDSRTALALPFFSTEMLAIVMPTRSASSVTLIFRLASMTSM